MSKETKILTGRQIGADTNQQINLQTTGNTGLIIEGGDMYAGKRVFNISDGFAPDLGDLANELAELKSRLKEKAQEAEQYESLSSVALAEKSAREGKLEDVLNQLKGAGKWALNMAQEVGVSLATEALKKALGIS